MHNSQSRIENINIQMYIQHLLIQLITPAQNHSNGVYAFSNLSRTNTLNQL